MRKSAITLLVGALFLACTGSLLAQGGTTRARGSDRFGPIGPAIVTGLNYNDLLVHTGLNGEIRQSESTKDLIFSVDEIVSYVSRYFTLQRQIPTGALHPLK